MRVIVWGLGYVGTVSAACLAQLRHDVIGVEPNLSKVEELNAGNCAIKEPGLDHLVSQMVATGRLRATQHGMTLLPLGGYLADLCGDASNNRWQPSVGLRM
jgi:GDP-mannose 6-dehydrogenase